MEKGTRRKSGMTKTDIGSQIRQATRKAEKGQKRQRVEAKRAERGSGRGFDLDKINRQLHDLVAKNTDLDVSGPQDLQ